MTFLYDIATFCFYYVLYALMGALVVSLALVFLLIVFSPFITILWILYKREQSKKKARGNSEIEVKKTDDGDFFFFTIILACISPLLALIALFSRPKNN